VTVHTIWFGPPEAEPFDVRARFEHRHKTGQWILNRSKGWRPMIYLDKVGKDK
jgi:hypothetical protein